MASRPILPPFLVVAAGDMSGNITSAPTIIQMLAGISYDISWTGTPTGTFSVQVSNSYSQNSDGSVRTAGTWNTLPAGAFVGTIPAPAGAPGNGFLDIVGTEAYAIRIVYTASSGSGTLSIVACAKVL